MAFTQEHFRIRPDDSLGLNTAYAGGDPALNASASLPILERIRIRFVVSSDASVTEGFTLEYNIDGAGWVDVADNAHHWGDGTAIDPVAAVPSDQFTDLAATTQLIGSGAFVAGDGCENPSSGTVTFSGSDETELEWCVKINKMSDGLHVADGAAIQFRVTQDDGTALGTYDNTPTVTVANSPGWIGGTFHEMGQDCGPFVDSNNNLYVISERSQTDNFLTVMKSTDNGVSWTEADAARNPTSADCEGGTAVLVDGTLHIIQKDGGVDAYYHQYRTSDAPAPSIRSSDSNTGGSPPISITKPAGLADGDWVVAMGYSQSDTTPTFSGGAAWTHRYQANNFCYATKFLAAGEADTEPASYTLAGTGGTVGAVFAVKNASKFIDTATLETYDATGDSSVAIPSSTSGGANRLSFVGAMTFSGPASGSFSSWTSGWVEAFDTNDGIGVAVDTVGSGATGAVAVTPSDTANKQLGFHLMFAPAEDEWGVTGEPIDAAAGAKVLSDDTATIVYRPTSGDYVVAYSGSDGGNGRCWIRSGVPGAWDSRFACDAEAATDFGGINLLVDADERIHIVYKDSTNGIIYHNTLDGVTTKGSDPLTSSDLGTRTAIHSDDELGDTPGRLGSEVYDDAGSWKVPIAYINATGTKHANMAPMVESTGLGTARQASDAAVADQVLDHEGAWLAPVAVDGTDIYVFWLEEDPADDFTECWYAVSANGAAFGTPALFADVNTIVPNDATPFNAATAGTGWDAISVKKITHGSGPVIAFLGSWGMGNNGIWYDEITLTTPPPSGVPLPPMRATLAHILTR